MNIPLLFSLLGIFLSLLYVILFPSFPSPSPSPSSSSPNLHDTLPSFSPNPFILPIDHPTLSTSSILTIDYSNLQSFLSSFSPPSLSPPPYPIPHLNFPFPLIITNGPPSLWPSTSTSPWSDIDSFFPRWQQGMQHHDVIEVKMSDYRVNKYHGNNKYYAKYYDTEDRDNEFGDINMVNYGEMEREKRRNGGLYNVTIEEFYKGIRRIEKEKGKNKTQNNNNNNNNNNNIHNVTKNKSDISNFPYLYYTDSIDVIPFSLRPDLIPFDYSLFLPPNYLSNSSHSPSSPSSPSPLSKKEFYTKRKSTDKGKDNHQKDNNNYLSSHPLYFESLYTSLCEFNLWLGTPLITASPHHDLVANIFTQIGGEKRFEIGDSRWGGWMGIGSRGGGWHRQMNKDWREGEESSSSSSIQYSNSSISPLIPIPIYNITLLPSHILYLPSGWYHRVLSLSSPLTSSLNMWCVEGKNDRLYEVIHHVIPVVERMWRGGRRRGVLRGMVEKVVEGVREGYERERGRVRERGRGEKDNNNDNIHFSNDYHHTHLTNLLSSPSHFLSHLLIQRYSPLFPHIIPPPSPSSSSSHHDNDNKDGNAHDAESREREKVIHCDNVKRYFREKKGEAFCEDEKYEMNEREKILIRDTAHNISQHLLSMATTYQHEFSFPPTPLSSSSPSPSPSPSSYFPPLYTEESAFLSGMGSTIVGLGDWIEEVGMLGGREEWKGEEEEGEGKKERGRESYTVSYLACCF